MSSQSRFYQLTQAGEHFRVIDAFDHCVVQSRDRQTAEHYADLLNKAYERGYKAGYRSAKTTTASE